MANPVLHFNVTKDLLLDIRKDPAATNKWLAKCKFTIDILRPGSGPACFHNGKEDGLLIGGVTTRYGYRGQNMKDGNEVLGRYHPDPIMGAGYHAYDVPRLGGTMVEGNCIEMELEFVGAVINKQTKETLQMKQWSFKAKRTVKGGMLV